MRGWDTRKLWFALLATAAIFSCTFCQAADDLIAGTLTGTHYQNVMYSFSVEIPQGWQVGTSETLNRVTSSAPKDVIVFLVLERTPAPGVPGTVIAIVGEKFPGTPGVSVEKVKGYGENVARATNTALLKDPFRVNIGGIDMYRADLKGDANEQEHYFSFLAVGIRDRVIVFQIHSSSQGGLDEAVRALMAATEFLPDYAAPKRDLDSSRPVVRVSQGVMAGLALKKVLPIYPDEAAKAHVRGYVVMNAEISREGKVQRLWVVDSNPELTEPTREAAQWQPQFTSAAVDAVSQWTFKPYILNGAPVRVITHITVNFPQ
jgi:hypothetical protein